MWKRPELSPLDVVGARSSGENSRSTASARPDLRWAELTGTGDRGTAAGAAITASWASFLSIAALAIILVLVLTATLGAPLKDDIAWLLHVAQDMLGGKRLYLDDIEINPPLIIWILAAPAKLADWISAPAEAVTVLFLSTAVLSCALWSAWLLRRYAQLFANRAAVFAVIGAVLLLTPGVEFGQREHLLVACTLPYLAVLALRLRGEQPGTALACCCGAVAAVGCALKPDYVIAFAAAEAVAAFRGLRPWRAETICAAALLLGYGAAIGIFFPVYLETIVPLARELYGASDASLGRLVLQSRTLLIGQAIVLLLWRGRVGRVGREPLFAVLAAFGCGATLACFVEGKDWFYHRLPATTVVVLALSYWTADMIAHPAPLGRAKLATIAAAACTLGAFGAAAADRLTPLFEFALRSRVPLETRIEALVTRSRPHRYMAFSQSLAPGFPVVNDTGIDWTSRFDSMWALRGVMWRLRSGQPAAHWPVLRWIVSDFIKLRPEMVVVDDRDGLDYIAILSRMPEFAAAWSNYRLDTAFDGIRVFRLIVGRMTASGRGSPRVAGDAAP